MTTYTKFVADIGGTHARFALVEPEKNTGRASLAEVKVFKCADFSSPAETVIAYQQYLGGSLPASGCIAAAGPVTDGEVSFTNLGWRLSARELQQSFKLKALEVVNDFTAVASSVSQLSDDEVVSIHCAPPVKDAVRVVIGAGTGLGVAALVGIDDQHHVVPSESGHCRFAPADAEELELLTCLLRTQDYVSFEMLLSGPGIKLLYNTLAEIQGRPVDNLRSSEITQQAVAGSDAQCTRTLTCYTKILAGFCSDLVITFHAKGGLYLSGDIFRSIEPLLLTDTFRQRYLCAGPMSEIAKNAPLSLVLAEDPGLRGAAARVMRL